MHLRSARHVFCRYQCHGIISAWKIPNQLVRQMYKLNLVLKFRCWRFHWTNLEVYVESNQMQLYHCKFPSQWYWLVLFLCLWKHAHTNWLAVCYMSFLRFVRSIFSINDENAWLLKELNMTMNSFFASHIWNHTHGHLATLHLHGVMDAFG